MVEAGAEQLPGRFGTFELRSTEPPVSDVVTSRRRRASG